MKLPDAGGEEVGQGMAQANRWRWRFHDLSVLSVNSDVAAEGVGLTGVALALGVSSAILKHQDEIEVDIKNEIE